MKKNPPIATWSPHFRLNRITDTLEDMKVICRQAKVMHRIAALETAQSDADELLHEFVRLKAIEAKFERIGGEKLWEVEIAKAGETVL